MTVPIGQPDRLVVQVKLPKKPSWKDVFIIENGLAAVNPTDETRSAFANIALEALNAHEEDAFVRSKDRPIISSGYKG